VRLHVSPQGADIEQVLAWYHQALESVIEQYVVRQLEPFISLILETPFLFRLMQLRTPAPLHHSGRELVPLKAPDVFFSDPMPGKKGIPWRFRVYWQAVLDYLVNKIRFCVGHSLSRHPT
jgi:hypothetical protein